MVSITGDTVTGKRIAQIAADTVKRLHLELGGKAPIIVFDDADVDLAAETLRFAGYWNSGQDCTAATRVIAGPEVYDKFVSALADQVRTIKWGDPAEGDDIEMGSLIAQAQADKVQGMVDRARGGAEVVVGGERPDRAGAYYAPTVIAGPDQKSEIIQDEIFGPVVTVQRFSDEDAGDRLGERHALRARVVDLHERHRHGRCGSPRRSSSATSGSTSTSRSRRRRRTAASSSPAGARTAPSTRSRTTRSSST